MKLFKRKSNTTTPLPEALKPEDPVNYSSVLDYLVGLSKEDHEKITNVTSIYREANEKAAVVLGIEDQPSTMLKPSKPTDEQVDGALDEALGTGHLDLLAEDEPPAPELKKEQEPSRSKKIDIKG